MPHRRTSATPGPKSFNNKFGALHFEMSQSVIVLKIVEFSMVVLFHRHVKFSHWEWLLNAEFPFSLKWSMHSPICSGLRLHYCTDLDELVKSGLYNAKLVPKEENFLVEVYVIFTRKKRVFTSILGKFRVLSVKSRRFYTYQRGL